jgi:hypothetical protein
MTTPLEKTLRRALKIADRDYVLAISPQGLKLTLKGHRKGLELAWDALVSGEAALATALNASVGRFTEPSEPGRPSAARTRERTRTRTTDRSVVRKRTRK